MKNNLTQTIGQKLKWLRAFRTENTLKIVAENTKIAVPTLSEFERDIEDLYMEVLNRYNLKESVEWNIDNNESLCDYLINLFNLK